MRTILLSQKHTATTWHYPANMRQHEISTRDAVARNIQALMRRHQMTQVALAKKSGVSQRHISSIVRAAAEAGTEKLDKIARVFGLRGWQLQMPNLPEDLLDSDVIGRVVRSLAEVPPKGREFIAETAVREAHFNRGDKPSGE